MSGEETLGAIAARYNLHPNVLRNWKKEFLEKAPELFDEVRWTWDTAASDGAVEVMYDYRPDGLRYSKFVDGVKTAHVLDGANVITDITGEAVDFNTRGTYILWDSNEAYHLFYAYGDVVTVAGAVTETAEHDAFGSTLTVRPMFGEPREVEIGAKTGSHGGGDAVMLDDIFGAPERDPLERAASHLDGAMSILTGIAANISIASGREIKVDDLVKF